MKKIIVTEENADSIIKDMNAFLQPKKYIRLYIGTVKDTEFKRQIFERTENIKIDIQEIRTMLFDFNFHIGVKFGDVVTISNAIMSVTDNSGKTMIFNIGEFTEDGFVPDKESSESAVDIVKEIFIEKFIFTEEKIDETMKKINDFITGKNGLVILRAGIIKDGDFKYDKDDLVAVLTKTNCEILSRKDNCVVFGFQEVGSKAKRLCLDLRFNCTITIYEKYLYVEQEGCFTIQFSVREEIN